MNAFGATANRLLASALAGAALFTLIGAGSAGAQVMRRVPGEAPGIPAYAQFGFDPIAGAKFILHDEQWAAIPFYRGPDCVPEDFNLVDVLDFTPDPDYGLRVFGCPLTVAGFEIWPAHGPDTQPISSVLGGPVQGYPFVAVYLVRYDELLAAMGDGVLTIAELDALPSLRIGHATFFQEVNGLGHLTEDGQYTSYHYELRAGGALEDASDTFSVHFTTGGRFGKSGKAIPNLVRAEIRFGR